MRNLFFFHSSEIPFVIQWFVQIETTVEILFEINSAQKNLPQSLNSRAMDETKNNAQTAIETKILFIFENKIKDFWIVKKKFV